MIKKKKKKLIQINKLTYSKNAKPGLLESALCGWNYGYAHTCIYAGETVMKLFFYVYTIYVH